MQMLFVNVCPPPHGGYRDGGELPESTDTLKATHYINGFKAAVKRLNLVNIHAQVFR